jgi:hypothetical protein
MLIIILLSALTLNENKPLSLVRLDKFGEDSVTVAPSIGSPVVLSITFPLIDFWE